MSEGNNFSLLFTRGGGGVPILPDGVPYPSWRGGGGCPQPVPMGGEGRPPPHRDWMGGVHAAGGMPLAFTQEDFLV